MTNFSQEIPIFLYQYQDCYIGKDERSQQLVSHLTGGAAAFCVTEIDRLGMLAEAHGWKIQFVERPANE